MSSRAPRIAFRTTLKRLFKGTPVEKAVRGVRHAIGLAPEHEKMAAEEDAAMKQIIAQTLGADSAAVDVGCHMGEMLAAMVRSAPQGQHHAFEPIPDQAAWLERRFPGVTIHRLAASDQEGEVTFFHNVDLPAYSGLKQQEVGGRVSELRVKTTPLDRILPATLPVRLLKIDVEGAELRVLRGAAGVIQRHRPVILFEFVRHASERFGDTPEAVFDCFADALNYEVRTVRSHLRGDPPLTRIAFSEATAQFRSFNYVAIPRTR